MDLKILEKFRRENFKQLDSKEKEAAVRELIQSIIEENNLTDVNVEAGEGFGYNSKTNTIIIQDFEEMEEVSSYEVLTGIIHEMKHKEQADKGILDPLIYQGFAYNISPNEVEAHRHASKTLMQLTSFFNDDQFDIYLLKLIDKDSKDQKESIDQIKRLGYTDKTPEEYARIHSEYIDRFVCKKDPLDEGKAMFLGGKYLLTYFEEDEIMKVLADSTNFYVKDGVAYIGHVFFMENISSTDIARGLKTGITVLENEYNEKLVNEIHFPPELIQLGIGKEQYESLVKTWNIKDGKISMEQLDEILQRPGIILQREKDEPNLFEMYSPEQLPIIQAALEQEEKLLALELGWADESDFGPNDKKGFIAMSQYKPEYSPEKLGLIFAGQINNLNTVMYEALTEEQIKEVMLAQLNGLAREDAIQIASSGEEAKKTRLELQSRKGIRPKVNKILLGDDFDVLLPDQEREDL